MNDICKLVKFVSHVSQSRLHNGEVVTPHSKMFSGLIPQVAMCLSMQSLYVLPKIF